MKWEGNRQSDNVEDRRDEGPSIGGGGFSFGGGRGIGVGTIVIALVAGWALGINPLTLLGVLSGGAPDQAPVAQAPAHRPPADDKMAAVRVDRAGRHRRRLAGPVRGAGQHLSRAQAGAVSRRHAHAPAAPAKRRWGRSIARATRRSTSTWASTRR